VIGFILTLAIAVSLSTNFAGNDANELAQADAAYRAGMAARADTAKARPHFLRAAETYEASWDGGNQTPAVARNMAQSRFLAGDLGRCVRDYRRGLRVFPHDPELRRGLAFAREQVAYPYAGELADAARPSEAASPLDRFRMPPLRLAWVAVGLSALGWFVLARAWFTARGGLALFGGALVLTATALGGWLWWEDSRLRARWGEPTVVVVGSGAELRTGNSDEYPKRLDGRLPAGVELKVLGERGGWLHVELAGSAAGWVPRDRVAPVE
jgi:hypothetical protein